MTPRHYTSVLDLTREETMEVLDRAARLRHEWHADHKVLKRLRGYTLAAIFEKPSLRTRVTFEAGMTQLGGHAIFLGPQDIQLGVRESIADVARNLSRWVQIIAARTFAHSTVTELAAWSRVPVINALSDLEHPCQALADFLTLQERFGQLQGLKLAYVGDGNNVAHSLLLMGALLGIDVAVAAPAGYAPRREILEQAQRLAERSGATISVTQEPREAVHGADAVYTDVWASMGQEHEAEQRRQIFASYRVTAELLAATGKPRTIFMHCLPAHRGEEVSAEVIDGPQSVVFEQAENRLHAQKALLLWLLGR
ncbi:ornithine carbamoyltransferase [Kallotenue papyrolyticum]|uniref:ornithine carbamoyltransferase n=1 Tax=Kallotenue papyrolyticum TaxID=1325125 RepID=UPI000492BD7A|nr:ornithine carbamoyltransferase [Kallotenue papyrolyticum]